MAKQTLTQTEIDEMVAAMEQAYDDQYGDEIEIVEDDEHGDYRFESDEYDEDRTFEFEDDGQPDEYTEWQDLYGGDDWDQGQFDDF